MRCLSLVLLSTCLIPAAIAQTNEAWTLTVDQSFYSEWVNDGAVDASGALSFVGSKQTSAGGFPLPIPWSLGVIARVDPQGTLVWYRTFGPTSWTRTSFQTMLLDSSGGVIAGGTLAPTAGDDLTSDDLIVRYDASGALTWSETLGIAAVSERVTALALDPSGDVWAAGSTSTNGGDFLVMRFTASGVPLFTTTWNGAANAADEAFAIAPDGLGGAYVVGRANWQVTSQLAVVHVAATGSIIWSRTFGMGSSMAFDVAVDGSGDAYVGGALDVAPYNAFALLKLDSTGNLVWQSIVSDPAHAQGAVQRVALDPRGDVIAVGAWWAAAPESDVLVRKYDSAGNVLWSRSWDGPGHNLDRATTAFVDAGGETYVAGYTTPAGTSYSNALVLRVDRDGNVRWWRSWGGTIGHDSARAIGVGPLGAVFAAGDIADASDADTRVARYDESAVPFCFGDGSAIACPCGNSSPPSERAGCTNSLGSAGRLDAPGAASLAGDTLVLNGGGMPNSAALYFQGAGPAGGGAGSVFGDGLQCASTPIVRLGTKMNAAGASSYPAPSDPSVSARGGVLAPGERAYQVWYRNVASFCTSAPFNLTNGLRVTWLP